MKIQHWAIIFLIIIVPFSIICRSVVNKKMLNLRDETRYNNIIDNATYDAVSQIKELADLNNLGKNVPITDAVAEASIDRFFNTLAVNFNLPFERTAAENYFDRYIPAIIIVGYDGLYVYSCERTDSGYQFRFKPKIPYSEVIDLGSYGNCVVNYTLDNRVRLFFDDRVFGNGFKFDNLGEPSGTGTRVLSGYVGVDIDMNKDGLPDFYSGDGSSSIKIRSGERYDSSMPGYYPNMDPYSLCREENRPYKDYLDINAGKKDIQQTIQEDLASDFNSEELSYYLFEWVCSQGDPSDLRGLRYLIDDGKSEHQYIHANTALHSLISFYNGTDLEDGAGYSPTNILGLNFSWVNKDYEYDDNRKVISDASEFHRRRRNTIIDTIISVLTEEFNEHNEYAQALGITYDFNIPNIAREEWNNTIDDISVLAFMQGMPMGTDSYYNNYSLGGSRIVFKTMILGEIVREASLASDANTHMVYHKSFCPCIAGDEINTNINNNCHYVIRSNKDKVERNWQGYLKATSETMDNYMREKANYMDELARDPDTTYKFNVGGVVDTFFEVQYRTNSPQATDRVGQYPVATRLSSGVVEEFLTEEDAKKAGFYACTECY